MDFCLTFPCNLLIACNHRLGTVFFKRIEPEKGLISDQSVIEACKPPGMAASRVRREKAALSSGCEPTRRTLQPEATGAVMEVTKWLKPSV